MIDRIIDACQNCLNTFSFPACSIGVENGMDNATQYLFQNCSTFCGIKPTFDLVCGESRTRLFADVTCQLNEASKPLTFKEEALKHLYPAPALPETNDVLIEQLRAVNFILLAALGMYVSYQIYSFLTTEEEKLKAIIKLKGAPVPIAQPKKGVSPLCCHNAGQKISLPSIYLPH